MCRIMAKTGLLILSNPTRIGGILPLVHQHVNKTLYIQWNPKIADGSQNWPLHSQTIGRIYFQASLHCQNLDVRVLLSTIKYPQLKINTKREIEILLVDKKYDAGEIQALKNATENINPECPVITLMNENHEEKIEFNNPLTNSKVYENVVLGGTFDRLHDGHKILLNEAVLRTFKKLTVGVTDTNMLFSKTLWELIEPCEERIKNLKDYLQDIDPSIEYNVVSIQDPFGPTKHDPSLQMIVVSAETLSGGKKVNELRASNGLRTLDVHAIPLVTNGSKLENEEDKISSSNFRMRLLGTRLKPPVKNTNFPQKPYVIGLTGGIASGKSSIGDRLQKLGAGLIDCDKLAHELYKPGMKCYKLIVENFGTKVICENGEINRKELGSIVFKDKTQLQKLNNLVWPAIGESCREKVKQLYKNGSNVVIIEAAVLLQAGWNDLCHETWACIIHPDEAVKRLKFRNGLSEEDARSRIASQPSNVSHVNAATVVFCSQWCPSFTQNQVEKAWNMLKKELEDSG